MSCSLLPRHLVAPRAFFIAPLRPQAWALSRWSAGLQGSWAGMRWVAGRGGLRAEEGTAAEVRAVFTVTENGESLEPAAKNSLGHT